MIRWLYVISLSGALISGQALYAQAGLPDSLVRERLPEAAPIAQQLEYSLHPGSGSRPYARSEELLHVPELQLLFPEIRFIAFDEFPALELESPVKNYCLPSSVDMHLKPLLFAGFQPERIKLHEGEYRLAGPLWRLGDGMVYGSGSQSNLLKIGVFNAAGIGYRQTLGERLMLDVGVQVGKWSVPHMESMSWSAYGSLSYRLDERLNLNVFGVYGQSFDRSYGRVSVAPFQDMSYGGTMSIDFSERWGVDMGVRRYRYPGMSRWETLPVMAPYYKMKNGQKLQFDFGGLLKSFFIDKFR